ncbi:hypothetical protein [Nodosilinea sp. FACHB-13]|uniref:hypothetical protein n=1 Tax=Cyanophyceae TaxID=3028117 RepID=UPI001686E39C|nr:hypothetical protein [Nodosilinea sp. FACHB-13]MBD2106703.1 hypothetical protein [Nodosilinea sp. FACHB-13]
MAHPLDPLRRLLDTLPPPTPEQVEQVKTYFLAKSAKQISYADALAARSQGDTRAADQIAAFERWCLAQSDEGMPFNTQSWAAWSEAEGSSRPRR